MLIRLQEILGLESTCGYIRLIRSGLVMPGLEKETWVPLDVHFGIPLFDQGLNKIICDRILSLNLFDSVHLRKHSRKTRELVLRLFHFIASHQDRHLDVDADGGMLTKIALPTHNISFDGKTLSSYLS